MSTSDAVPLPAETTNTIMKRVDSDCTDESPFGSTLTTPIDEDVVLFSGIEQRLLDKDLNSHGDEAVVYLGPQEALDGQELLKVIQDGSKLAPGDALKAAPTPSPSLDQLNVNPSRLRAGSIYSQPNLPLPIPGETPDAQLEEYPFFDHSRSIPSVPDSRAPPVSSATDTGPPAPNPNKKLLPELTVNHKAEESAQIAQEPFSSLPVSHSWTSLDDIALANDILDSSSLSLVSLRSLVPTLLRVVLFVPWCVLAGGTILLFPGYLEPVIFGPGYTTSPKGIHRFAFWADAASELVSIFVAALVILLYTFPMAGLLAIGSVLAQVIYVWQSFEFDRNVPLGEDDRQAVYLIWKQYRFADAIMGMKKTDKGFLITGVEKDDMDTEDEKDL